MTKRIHKERTVPYKMFLTEEELPTHFYNVRADMAKKPEPLLNPGTLEPLTAAELSGIFCEELVAQELDDDKELHLDEGNHGMNQQPFVPIQDILVLAD